MNRPANSQSGGRSIKGTRPLRPKQSTLVAHVAVHNRCPRFRPRRVPLPTVAPVVRWKPFPCKCRPDSHEPVESAAGRRRQCVGYRSVPGKYKLPKTAISTSKLSAVFMTLIAANLIDNCIRPGMAMLRAEVQIEGKRLTALRKSSIGCHAAALSFAPWLCIFSDAESRTRRGHCAVVGWM